MEEILIKQTIDKERKQKTKENIDDIKAKVEKIEHLLLSEFEKTLKQLQESIVNLTQGQEKHKKSIED